jgi:uncharacterized protein YndB with AHSA1/START domain
MSEQATNPTVFKEVTVEASQQHAFEVFTAEIGSWWPIDSHHVGATPATAVLEARPGGRWYERSVDGQECEWGRVLEWEPPERVLLAWHLGADWAYDPDPQHATEVEVRFLPEGPDRTRVELEHRGFERLGERAEDLRGPVDSPGGWSLLLERFAAGVREES